MPLNMRQQGRMDSDNRSPCTERRQHQPQLVQLVLLNMRHQGAAESREQTMTTGHLAPPEGSYSLGLYYCPST